MANVKPTHPQNRKKARLLKRKRRIKRLLTAGGLLFIILFLLIFTIKAFSNRNSAETGSDSVTSAEKKRILPKP